MEGEFASREVGSVKEIELLATQAAVVFMDKERWFLIKDSYHLERE